MKQKKYSPLVSILLNCYNAEKFIGKAIESVISQSYKNWELVIWDDGSTDNTLKIIESYKDDRIFIFKQKKNVGLGKSRIQAIKHLKGEFVSIIDADDRFHEDKIAKQVKILNENEKISICSTWTKIFDNENNLRKIFESNLDTINLKQRLKFINIFPHSSIMYRKKDALKVEWYSKKLEFAQDYDLTIKLIKNGELFLIKEFLTEIYQPFTNMSQSKNLRKIILEENIYIGKKVINLFELEEFEIKILNDILDIYNIKLNLLFEKKKYISCLIKIFLIIIKNPLIIFKINILKKLEEKNNVRNSWNN